MLKGGMIVNTGFPKIRILKRLFKTSIILEQENIDYIGTRKHRLYWNKNWKFRQYYKTLKSYILRTRNKLFVQMTLKLNSVHRPGI